MLRLVGLLLSSYFYACALGYVELPWWLDVFRLLKP